MELYFREDPRPRYGLHDTFVSDIDIEEDQLTFYFNEGIYPAGQDEEKREARIVFKKIDYDFSEVMIIKGSGQKKRFKGKRVSFKAFKKMLQKGSFEILDETYSGYLAVWRGYYYRKEKIDEVIISILYLGLMTYYVEESK